MADPPAAELAVEQPAATAISSKKEEDEEEDECRICRQGGDPENPLVCPCACRGSIKFVHAACLLPWLLLRNSRLCEVCGQIVSFAPEHLKPRPARRLTARELLVQWSKQALYGFCRLIPLAFAVLFWMLVVPLITSWIWQLVLVRSFGEASRLVVSRFSINLIKHDFHHGFRMFLSLDNFWMIHCGTIRAIFLRNRFWIRQINGVCRIVVDTISPFLLWVGHREGHFARVDVVQYLVLALVEASYMVIVANALCAAAFAFIPFSVGRIVLWSVVASPISAKTIAKNIATCIKIFLAKVEASLIQFIFGVSLSLLGANGVDKISGTIITYIPTEILEFVEGKIGSEQLSNTTILLVGYGCVFSLFIFYIGLLVIQFARASK